jgi:hypothetical protein
MRRSWPPFTSTAKWAKSGEGTSKDWRWSWLVRALWALESAASQGLRDDLHHFQTSSESRALVVGPRARLDVAVVQPGRSSSRSRMGLLAS